MAISFDASSHDKDSDVSSLTFSHTVGSGSNRILVVGIYNKSGGDLVTSVTFNGTALTRLGTASGGSLNQGYLYYLLNPDTGTHNIVVTLSGETTALHAAAASFFGVDSLDNLDTDSGTNGYRSLSISGLGSGDWCVGICAHTSGTSCTLDAGDDKRAEEWGVTVATDDDGSLGFTFTDSQSSAVGGRLVSFIEEHSGSGTISGTGSLVVSGIKEGIGTGTISGTGSLVVSGIKEGIGTGTISGGGSLTGSGIACIPVFVFEKELTSNFQYIENIDEVRNHIVVEGEKYTILDDIVRLASGEDMMDESIEDRHLKQVVTELPYEAQEVVTPSRDVIVPFYLPSSLLTVNYVEMNLYFPGLQDGDYPKNSPNIYLTPTNWMMLVKKNGSFVDPGNEIDFEVGTGANGSDYWWYRGFLRYHLASLFGFKVDKAELHWSLRNKAFRGSGANAQHSIDLDSINDFGTPSSSMWGMATEVDHGVIQEYTDSNYGSYLKAVTERVSSLVGELTSYACFRLRSDSEPTDVNNANNYRYQIPWTLYVELSEDTSESVSVYADNGSGFGSCLGSYNSDQEEIDLTSQFSGSGRKRIKLTCSKTRRVDVLIRVGLTISR